MTGFRFLIASSLCAGLCVTQSEAQQSKSRTFADPSQILVPHIVAGSSLSDITYRVIALHGQGFEDRVAQMPATGTFVFDPSDDPSTIKWKFSVRMDGKTTMEGVPGEYRDSGRTQCFKDKCNVMSDASSPFFNPTFWGDPKGKLTVGMSWKVELKEPWELGPAGTQTVTVLALDPTNGMVILKREGEGDGPYEGKHASTTVKKDGKIITVSTTYGKAHWVGQAIFKRGVTVSDELLTITPVTVSSAETGTVVAEERQYMSLLQHPDPIPVASPSEQSAFNDLGFDGYPPWERANFDGSPSWFRKPNIRIQRLFSHIVRPHTETANANTPRRMRA